MKQMTYIYFAYKNAEVIYRCKASSISEAHNMLLEAKGINAEKDFSIGCIPWSPIYPEPRDRVEAQVRK